jgi:hypothetical protein
MKDVSLLLPPGDGVEPEVERILRLVVHAFQARQRRGKQFLPRQATTLVAFTSEGHTLHITSHVRRDGNVFTEIHSGDTVLREFHTHDGHRNPAPTYTPVPGSHVHFPSRRNPLVYRGNSYAYCVDCDWVETAFEGIQALCDELDFTIIAAQPGAGW